MAGKSVEASGGGTAVRSDGGFFSQVRGMIAALWTSRQRNTILFLVVALIAIVGATAYAQVRLNAWNEPFYDALAHKNFSEFVRQLIVFAELAGVLLALNVAQMWLNQKSKLVLREGLVEDLLSEWLSPLRAFRLSHAGEIGANPDQRIHEDARHLTELTTDLGIGLLQSTLLLLSFIGVLWVLSDKMVLAMAGFPFVPQGYMVWCALIYAGVASFVSWRVGRPLIALNAERYAREADFRFALVRANEEVEGVTLYGGEADERARLQGVFSAVVEVSERLVRAVTGLTWVTAGYGWFTIIAPILVAAPAYFHSGMTLGELMMLVGAFNQVQQSLRWFVDNFASIADWRATLLRVASFRNTLSTMDELGRERQSNRIGRKPRTGPSGWTTSRSPPRPAAPCRARTSWSSSPANASSPWATKPRKPFCSGPRALAVRQRRGMLGWMGAPGDRQEVREEVLCGEGVANHTEPRVMHGDPWGRSVDRG